MMQTKTHSSSQPKKIGLYGGSFDPIHFGHLNLAIELKEIHKLDEIWFCPARLSPHKTRSAALDASLRFEMVKLAVEDVPDFRVIDNEINRQPPSYTIETLRELKNNYPTHVFSLLLGEDAIPGFFHWKEPLEILKIANIYVGSRTGEFATDVYAKEDPQIVQALDLGMTRTRLVEISATLVRDRLSRRVYIGHLVPAKVIDFIKKNQLYSIK